MSECYLCPRMCGVDRAANGRGVCRQGDTVRISRAALHMFEEPPISGTRGSGTVFFSGCSLRCVFCQNRDISRGEDIGSPVSASELADIFLRLEAEGAHNINLVTPTHFANGIITALELVKPRLSIPVVYNTSGYERVETLRGFEGLVDIYLPDFKYASRELAAKYSAAPDYPDVALSALSEMFRQVGEYSYGKDGMLKNGLVVRHLILPSGRRDSMEVLRLLSELLPVHDILLSLMSQYTPEFADDCQYSELRRRLTSFEYDSVLKYAEELGFDGFMQGREAATTVYTPDFGK